MGDFYFRVKMLLAFICMEPIVLHRFHRFSSYPEPVQSSIYSQYYRLGGLVVKVPGYRSRGPGSIAGATRFSEK
jgi:hypothetical protein